MTLTLSEYFEDFKQWIEEPYFFWELVKGIIIIITNGYIESLLITKPTNLECEDLAHFIQDDVKILDEYFGNQDEFSDIKKLWKKKSNLLDAIHCVLSCEPGFFEGFAKPIHDNNEYGEKLLKYIEKLRKKKEKKDKMREIEHEYFDDELVDKSEIIKSETVQKIQNSKLAKWVKTKVQSND